MAELLKFNRDRVKQWTGLPHTSGKQKDFHSIYNKDYMRNTRPNVISDSVIGAAILYCTGKVGFTGSVAFVEAHDCITSPAGTLSVCVLAKRNKTGRFSFKTACIDENGIIQKVPESDSDLETDAIVASLLPFVLDDPEANDYFSLLRQFVPYIEKKSDFPEGRTLENLHEILLILSDNIYRRMKLEAKEPGAIVLSSNMKSILRQNDLQIHVSKPDGFDSRYFSFLSNASQNEEFFGKYQYNERKFTPDEERLIPHLRDDYVLPDFVVKTCRRFKATSDFPSPMRTALFTGPSGAGKTDGSRAVFAGLKLPRLFTTCHENTEILDLIGQIMPAGNSSPISFDEVRKALGLPGTDEVMYDTCEAYKKVYGKEPEGLVDEGELLREICQRTADELNRLGSHGKDFVYIESDFIRAVKNGYGFELQEVDMIKRSSLIVGLNALLESGHNSFITLPTGEVIKKHPDCTIIFTDNGNYEGARRLNQAILSRMSMVFILEDPTEEQMRERAMKRLNFPNDLILRRMVRVIKNIQTYLKNNEVTDGVCGQRELENWAMAVMVDSQEYGSDVYNITDELVHNCAIETVINKSSQDPDDVARVRTACLDKEFVG